MDVSHILDPLNDAQRQAVTAQDPHMLIVAGAGSGKTRVLTHRVAWLIQTENISPYAMLAVTFTNKAAAEMRGRIEQLMGTPTSGMWAGTFHGLAHRMLRTHWQEAGLPQTFQILDSEDQYRLLRRILKGLELDDSKWPPKEAQWFINARKDEGRRPPQCDDNGDFHVRQMIRIYQAYEEACERAGLVDFAELLLRSHELLKNNQDILQHYQQRFRHILVDEFQDTNTIQYQWIRMLAGSNAQTFMVGDDDQCLPAGASVSMADGSCRPIESIQPGDAILSSFGSGNFRAARVVECFERQYSGPIIDIRTRSGRVISSTPAHTHFAGYVPGESPQTYFLYLMYKEGIGFRLGTTQVYTNAKAKPQIGYMLRSIQEHADATWIVRVHDSENGARADEAITSLQYGIPTLPFMHRKGSKNGLVHDAGFISKVFTTLDTRSGAERLLRDAGLDMDQPHHKPQGRNSNRRNIMITLCGDARGLTPMHRISVVGIDNNDRIALENEGLSVRPARRGSPSWRFETVRKDFGELLEIARQIKSVLSGSRIVLNAHMLPKSLPFIKASAVRTGMVVATEDGNLDVVESVESRTGDFNIYDINIESTHNFIANGVITHNSIYGWRGARIENIYRFEKDFPGARIVRLEQNYRSTRTILNAANSLIANNTGRLGKNLWTEGGDGEPIGLYTAFNELDEANFIVQQIQHWIEQGNRRSESAILYRSNAQSRVLEEALIREGIPYRVYGGLRFFERMEIKDALAYLRLIANRRDDASFERVVNTPTRGIGQRTVDELRALAKRENISLWEAAIQMVNTKMLNARAGNAVLAFLNLIEGMARDTTGLQLFEQVEHMLQHSELVAHYKKEKGEKAQSRVENLEELVTATRYFEKSDDDAEMDTLSAFLSHASLEAGEGQASEWEDCVQLMTLHSAKGLEFDLVFLGGVEEGLFPHQRSIDEPGRLEEERRLCYVGMTRARQKLFITNAEVRRLYGSETYTRPSRFISELPAEHVHEIRMRSMVSRPSIAARHDAPAMSPFSGTEVTGSGFKLGQRVSHAKFGEGTVVNYEGQGSHARVQVNFERKGSKWLVAAYANLTTA